MVERIVSQIVRFISFGLYHFMESDPKAPANMDVMRCRRDCWCDAYAERVAERNYQYILDDWKKEVSNTNMRKPKIPLHVACMQVSVRYLDKKRELQRMVDHLKEHPREAHWHIPNHIRVVDFLEFYQYIPETMREKLRYLYEAERS